VISLCLGDFVAASPHFNSEEMKRKSKLIFLLAGCVAGSYIMHLAMVGGKVDLHHVHQFVDRQRFVTTDTLWPVFKPAANQGKTNGELDHNAKN
jgi:hypothetical protein